MNITENDAAHLAQLSSISLSDGELASLTADLENIMQYIEQLSELDTSGVEPTYQVTGLRNVWRTDVVESQIGRHDLLSLAPEQQDNQVKVPKVL